MNKNILTNGRRKEKKNRIPLAWACSSNERIF